MGRGAKISRLPWYIQAALLVGLALTTFCGAVLLMALIVDRFAA